MNDAARDPQWQFFVGRGEYDAELVAAKSRDNSPILDDVG